MTRQDKDSWPGSRLCGCEKCGGGEQLRFGSLAAESQKMSRTPATSSSGIADLTGMGSTLSLCAIQDGARVRSCAYVPPPLAANWSGGSCTVSILKDSFAILCQAVMVSLPSPPLDTISHSCSTLGIEFGIGSRPCSNRTGRDWRDFLEFGEDACEDISTWGAHSSLQIPVFEFGATTSGKKPEVDSAV